MTALIAAAAFFVLLHLLIAGTRLRGAIVGAIGEGAYMGLFSLASIAGLAWLGFAYGAARGGGDLFWDAGTGARHATFLIQFIAVQFIVIGIVTPNPTSVKGEGAIDRADVVKGMLRVTRHPFLWGVAIWSAGHLLVNGDTPGVLLFGSMLVLSVLGTSSIDAKRRRALGDKWDGFSAQTSNLPFGAILGGRQKLSLGEIGLWRFALATVVWAALIAGHRWLSGVSLLT